MRFKIFIFYLIYAMTLTRNVTAYLNQESETSHRDINYNFMKINEKIDFYSKKIEKLEENSPTENNVLSQMMKSILELNKKTDTILEFIGKTNIKKVDIVKSKREVVSELGSRCKALCEAEVDVWVNQTNDRIQENLKKIDFCLIDSAFINNTKLNVSSIIDTWSASRVNAFERSSSACEPNPCANGGQCRPLAYECTNCPYLTSGTRCEKLNCNKANRCVQYENTLYVVIEESGSWDFGYQKCIDQGMRLASPKQSDTSAFLINHLKTIYAPARGLHFWIGVKNNGTSVHRWIDGTLLGDFTGGKPDFKGMTGERWGLMWLHGGGVTWWPRSLAEIASNYGANHFTLCEKPISIRVK